MYMFLCLKLNVLERQTDIVVSAQVQASRGQFGSKGSSI